MLHRRAPHVPFPVIALVALAATAAACATSTSGGGSGSQFGSPSSGGDPSGGGGDGTGGGSFDVDGGPASSGAESGAPTTNALTMTIRDFRLYNGGDSTTNPDFENVPKTDQNGNPNGGYTGPWDDRGIVGATLGADGKPVYAGASGHTLTTHGKSAFDQWYRDVPGTNVNVAYPITLSPGADGSFEFDSEKTGVPLSPNDPHKMFFPIDDGTPFATPFGNQGDPHNYSFTVELHTVFTYRGGEFFHFRGDDDVWVFIDGKRVIDLGGIHGPEEVEVKADDLGLTQGKDYPLDFFSAERHKTGSNILFTTTLGLRPAPPR